MGLAVVAVEAVVVEAVVVEADFTVAGPGPASAAAELVPAVAEGVLAWAEQETVRTWEVEAPAGRILAVVEEDRPLVAAGRGPVWRASIAPAAIVPPAA